MQVNSQHILTQNDARPMTLWCTYSNHENESHTHIRTTLAHAHPILSDEIELRLVFILNFGPHQTDSRTKRFRMSRVLWILPSKPPFFRIQSSVLLMHTLEIVRVFAFGNSACSISVAFSLIFSSFQSLSLLSSSYSPNHFQFHYLLRFTFSFNIHSMAF